jgi:hypothetical protein
MVWHGSALLLALLCIAAGKSFFFFFWHGSALLLAWLCIAVGKSFFFFFSFLITLNKRSN